MRNIFIGLMVVILIILAGWAISAGMKKSNQLGMSSPSGSNRDSSSQNYQNSTSPKRATILIKERNGSQESGRVTFSQLDDGKTKINIDISSLSGDNIRHYASLRSGTCASPGGEIRSLSYMENGRIESEIEDSFDDLGKKGAMHISILRSERNDDSRYSCIDLSSSGSDNSSNVGNYYRDDDSREGWDSDDGNSWDDRYEYSR